MTRVERATWGVMRDVGVVRGMASACLCHIVVDSKEVVRASLIEKKEYAGALLN